MRVNFNELLASLPTVAVLEYIGQQVEGQGKSVKVLCSICKNVMAFTTAGTKKNIGFCPTCKKGYNILQQAENITGKKIHTISAELASTILKLRQESNQTLELDLELHPAPNIHPEIQKELDFGFCKKGIMAGHLTFAIHNQNGDKIAYIGKSSKTGKWKYPAKFNPELTLYNIHRITGQWIYVFGCIEEAIRYWCYGIPTVSTFNQYSITLPQLEQLQRFKYITLVGDVPFYPFLSEIAKKTQFIRQIKIPKNEKEILSFY